MQRPAGDRREHDAAAYQGRRARYLVDEYPNPYGCEHELDQHQERDFARGKDLCTRGQVFVLRSAMVADKIVLKAAVNFDL